jgi:hypothetical protein
VWGSIYAIYVGAVEGEARAGLLRTITAALAKPGEIEFEGALRQVPLSGDASPTTMWEKARHPKNTYMNGAYWHVPIGWLLTILQPGHPELSQTVKRRWLGHLRAEHGKVWECIGWDRKANKNPSFGASISLPLGTLSQAEPHTSPLTARPAAKKLSEFQPLVRNEAWTEKWPDAAGKLETREVTAEVWTQAMQASLDAQGTLHFLPNGSLANVANRTHAWNRATVDVVVPVTVSATAARELLRAVADDARARVTDDGAELAEVAVEGPLDHTDKGATWRLMVRCAPPAVFSVRAAMIDALHAALMVEKDATAFQWSLAVARRAKEKAPEASPPASPGAMREG